jgi:hypothetical protein
MEQLEDVKQNDQLRDRAVRRLKKKRDLQAHALVYVLVNAFLVAIWTVTGANFFWPVFPMAGWGIGLVMNVWDVYRSDEPKEAEVRAEMDRLRRAT